MNGCADKREIARDENLNDLFALVRSVAEDITHLRVELRTLKVKLEEHIGVEEKELDRLGHLVRAFPHIEVAGEKVPDVDGHCNDHLTRIGDAKETKRRWQKIKDLIVEMSIRSVYYGAVFIFLLGLKDWIQHPTAPSAEKIESKVEALK